MKFIAETLLTVVTRLVVTSAFGVGCARMTLALEDADRTPSSLDSLIFFALGVGWLCFFLAACAVAIFSAYDMTTVLFPKAWVPTLHGFAMVCIFPILCLSIFVIVIGLFGSGTIDAVEAFVNRNFVAETAAQ